MKRLRVISALPCFARGNNYTTIIQFHKLLKGNVDTHSTRKDENTLTVSGGLHGAFRLLPRVVIVKRRVVAHFLNSCLTKMSDLPNIYSTVFGRQGRAGI